MEKYATEYGELYLEKLELKSAMKEIDTKMKANLKVIEDCMVKNNIPILPIKVGDTQLNITLEQKCSVKK